jgi:CubicO group peptidase (beta-lactamase class C family)
MVGADAAGTQPEAVAPEVEQRIARVEQGLLPTAVPAGTKGQGQRLSDRMKQYRVPGLSVAVVNDGKVEWARGYGVVESGRRGKVNSQTLLQAGSISKVVAALGALRLVQQGRIGLDEDVNRKLVSWKIPENSYTRSEKVTLRRLLTHTAGITVHGFARYRSDLPVPTLLETLEGRPPANNIPIRVDLRPGSAWRYSGGGYVVLEQLVSDLTGEPFARYVGRTVLAPLGMMDSTFEALTPWERKRAATGHLPDRETVPGGAMRYGQHAAAGLWTTPTDLAKLIVGLQAVAAGQPGALLGPKVAGELFTPYASGWGLGLQLSGEGASRRFTHGGSNEGFDSFFTGTLRTGQGLVVMANANLYDPDDDLFGEVERAVAAEYHWPGFTIAQQEYVKLPERVLKPWRGRYRLSPGVMVDVDTRDGRLEAYYPGEGASTLYPRTEHEFFPALPILARAVSFRMAATPGTEQQAMIELQREGKTVSGPRLSPDPLRSLGPIPDLDPTATERLFHLFTAWSNGSDDLAGASPELRVAFGRAAAHYVTAHLPGLRKLTLLAQEALGPGELTRGGAAVRRVNTYRTEARNGKCYLTVYLTADHQLADYELFRR